MKTKRFWLVLLAILSVLCMAFAIAGCGDNNGEVKPPVDPEEGNTRRHEHTWSEWVIVKEAKECSDEPGLRRRTCTDPNCPKIADGGNVEEEVIPAIGHPQDSLRIYPAQDPTCTEDGWDEYFYCSKCQATNKEEKLRPKLGHSMTTIPAQTANCYQEGWDEYQKCSRCGYEEGEKNLKPMTDHTWVQQPDGSSICSVCHQPKLEDTLNLEYQVSADGTYFTVKGYKKNDKGQILDEAGNVYTYQDPTVIGGDSNLKSREILNVNEEGVLCETSTAADGTTTYTPIQQYNKMMTLVIPANHTEGETTLPVRGIEKEAFAGCAFITRLSINNFITTIPQDTFRECRGLKEVTFGQNVSEIQGGSLSYTALESLDFPRKVSSIGMLAFAHCDRISKITVDKNNMTYYTVEGSNCILTRNGDENTKDQIILGCKDSKIPDKAVSVGNWAFAMCATLTEINLNKVKRVGTSAFMLCHRLQKVTMGRETNEIGVNAFYGCVSLEDLTLGAGLTRIGNTAFANCYKLRVVKYSGTKAQFMDGNKFVKGERWDFNDGLVKEDGTVVDSNEANWQRRNYLIELQNGDYLISSQGIPPYVDYDGTLEDFLNGNANAGAEA